MNPENQYEDRTPTQIMQDKADKLKLLNLAKNIHNLTPPLRQEEDGSKDIALIKSLSAHPRIQAKIMEIRGLEYDFGQKVFVQVVEPRMNYKGAKVVADILRSIAEETEWSSYSEEEINPRIIHYYEEVLPYITFFAEEYELKTMYIGYISSMIKVFIDSSFHKAKSGKYINTLGRTYDEGILKRALETDPKTNKKEEGFLSRMNPFREGK